MFHREAYCEMKIKEKGLTGKAAIIRRNEAASAPNPRGFNAFREMERAKKGDKTTDEKKPEVWLEFMGTKIRVLEKEDGDKEGYVNEEDVPYVKGSALKFSGCGGDVPWGEIKVCNQLFYSTYAHS
jgi:lupus La protein